MACRYRLTPTPEQEVILRVHCAHARFVWNLGHEQRLMWRPGRPPTPGFAEQSRQLTEARLAEPWLAEGSRKVQDQALRDLDRAWQNFFKGTHRRPRWRTAKSSNGFRIAGRREGSAAIWHVRRVSRHVGEVHIPKIGRVRFRWSRAVPTDAKSYRVTLDRSGRWHVAFTGTPPAIPRPLAGGAIGIDRGVRTSLVSSDGQHFRAPRISDRTAARYTFLARRRARQWEGSARYGRTVVAMARISAAAADRRKDWAEKLSTRMIREHDLIVLEKLNIAGLVRSPAPKPDPNMAGAFLPNRSKAKAALSRGILASCWDTFATRLEQKAAASGATVLQVDPRFTSQQCHVCGHTESGNRESQAVFRCLGCGHEDHADRNAARNILARGLLATGGEIPAHAPGHGASRPRQTAKAAAGTIRGAS